jgi:alpha-beta hydrolase superfamily lysophospholipase
LPLRHVGPPDDPARAQKAPATPPHLPAWRRCGERAGHLLDSRFQAGGRSVETRGIEGRIGMAERSKLGRREVILAAGAALTAGLAGEAGPAAAAADEIVRSEYWAKKGEVSLYLFRKRLASAPAATRGTLFFVHGSSNSAGTSFDLAVPGKGEYSIMNVFARAGFDVWSMDHEGYGRSSRTSGNSDIASGVEDLKAATEVVARETGRGKMHFFGTSSGAIRAAAFAQAHGDRVDRLVLSAFTYKGTGSPTLQRRAERLESYRTHNTRKRDADMIRSIFTRDGLASSYDPAVAEAMAEEELKFGDQVPTGTYLDMTANLPLVDPVKVTCPVMLVRGDHDGIATMEDLLDFYRQLPNGDRQFVVLPNTAHSPIFANNRHLLWHVVREFLDMPAVAA